MCYLTGGIQNLLQQKPCEGAKTYSRAKFDKETVAGAHRRPKWVPHYGAQADSGLAQDTQDLLRLCSGSAQARLRLGSGSAQARLRLGSGSAQARFRLAQALLRHAHPRLRYAHPQLRLKQQLLTFVD
jgi:hypothetical protein